MMLSVLLSLLSSVKKSCRKSVIAIQIASLPPPPPDPICHHPTMQLLEPVTASEVFRMLSSIPSKTSVLDFVPTSVVKSCPALLSDLIAHLANLSFSNGVSPSKCKHASVSRLFSRNQILIHPNLQTIVQFRTSTIFRRSLIIERLFLTRLQSHIVSSPNFNPLQSAYRRYHSTETSLVHLLDSVYHECISCSPLELCLP